MSTAATAATAAVMPKAFSEGAPAADADALPTATATATRSHSAPSSPECPPGIADAIRHGMAASSAALKEASAAYEAGAKVAHAYGYTAGAAAARDSLYCVYEEAARVISDEIKTPAAIPYPVRKEDRASAFPAVIGHLRDVSDVIMEKINVGPRTSIEQVVTAYRAATAFNKFSTIVTAKVGFEDSIRKGVIAGMRAVQDAFPTIIDSTTEAITDLITTAEATSTDAFTEKRFRANACPAIKALPGIIEGCATSASVFDPTRTSDSAIAAFHNAVIASFRPATDPCTPDTKPPGDIPALRRRAQALSPRPRCSKRQVAGDDDTADDDDDTDDGVTRLPAERPGSPYEALLRRSESMSPSTAHLSAPPPSRQPSEAESAPPALKRCKSVFQPHTLAAPPSTPDSSEDVVPMNSTISDSLRDISVVQPTADAAPIDVDAEEPALTRSCSVSVSGSIARRLFPPA